MAKLFAGFTPPEIEVPIHYPTASPTVRRQVRKHYQELQENLCDHCMGHLSQEPTKHITRLSIEEQLFPKNFFDHPVHLHHDHGTGMTIGAVHAYCNAVLWQHHGE